MNSRGRPPHPDILTPAEWRVVEGVRHGLTNPAIARLCGLSSDAVKFHVSNVLGKLGLQSRSELRRWQGVRADSAMATRTPSNDLGGLSLGQVSRTARDLEATADWFRDVVGLAELMRFPNAAFFDCGGVRLYLSAAAAGPNAILYFLVPDIAAEIERLKAAGVVILSAPHRIHVHPDGREEWMAFFADPDGGSLGLMSVVAPNTGENQ
ncbi:MAG: LuxR C-terminal-related transcriptional regulator [Blastomonas sp.]|uniref:LuxR C-terminal-related transcriptional regulator n=1 Tax=Blastomonas sp. TaxID=1909299 RepID=UPI0009C0C0C6|nr:LuxR C-terminal-related transcriptional regulator [Blastomonas sp.]